MSDCSSCDDNEYIKVIHSNGVFKKPYKPKKVKNKEKKPKATKSNSTHVRTRRFR